MKYSSTRVNLLEDTYALTVLLALQKEGPTPRGVLYNMITKANRTVMYRVNTLIEEGLIKEVAQVSPPFAKYLELTEKGKRVAECVECLEKALGD